MLWFISTCPKWSPASADILCHFCSQLALPEGIKWQHYQGTGWIPLIVGVQDYFLQCPPSTLDLHQPQVPPRYLGMGYELPSSINSPSSVTTVAHLFVAIQLTCTITAQTGAVTLAIFWDGIVQAVYDTCLVSFWITYLNCSNFMSATCFNKSVFVSTALLEMAIDCYYFWRGLRFYKFIYRQYVSYLHYYNPLTCQQKLSKLSPFPKISFMCLWAFP